MGLPGTWKLTLICRGRVGAHGQTAFWGNGSLNDAIKQYEKKFKDKSGLAWADRLGDPHPGKYVG